MKKKNRTRDIIDTPIGPISLMNTADLLRLAHVADNTQLQYY